MCFTNDHGVHSFLGVIAYHGGAFTASQRLIHQYRHCCHIVGHYCDLNIYNPKKPAAYFSDVKTMIPASIHSMVFGVDPVLAELQGTFQLKRYPLSEQNARIRGIYPVTFSKFVCNMQI